MLFLTVILNVYAVQRQVDCSVLLCRWTVKQESNF